MKLRVASLTVGLLLLNAGVIWAQGTSTPTSISTPVPCATDVIWGETNFRPNGIGFDGETWVQKYNLPQSAQVNFLAVQLISVSAGTTFHMGIYSDNNGNPSNLIYVTPLQTALDGLNKFYVAPDHVNLVAGDYWFAVSSISGSMFVTNGGGANLKWGVANGDMPNSYPSDYGSVPGNGESAYLYADINTCDAGVSAITPLPTNTPYMTATSSPTPTRSPTITPTPSSTPSFTSTTAPIFTPTATPMADTLFNNSDAAVAAAFGCTVQVVDEVRQLNLDVTTSYIIMRLCALGLGLDQIEELRLNLGWDEICAQYGIDWSSFSTDIQTRMNNLQPEMITPNQVLRGAANDPSQFPSTYPSPMPDNLTINSPIAEVCPLCH